MDVAIEGNERTPARRTNGDVGAAGAMQPQSRDGSEADVNLLRELVRDALAVHAIIHGLRGRDRNQIERILSRLPAIPPKGENDRDIMQLVYEDEERQVLGRLDAEVYRALNHLAGNQSSYLGLLKRLAAAKCDWREVPNPAKP